MQIVTQLLLGAAGGLVRSIVGVIKHFSTQKKPTFSVRYIVLTTLGSAAIGAFVGVLVSGDYRLILASGYLGMDVVEGVVKSYMKKTTLV
ncbi:MAG TPA: hypothetical protein VJB66_00895 [Candidatus Nanoarchaeia archaeon]|nr:hypothetical protein [Candidatus Nanoarchaeia archaeon]